MPLQLEQIFSKYYGPLHVSLTGDVNFAKQYIPIARTIVGDLLVRSSRGGIEVAARHVAINDRVHIYAKIGPNLQSVIITADRQVTEAIAVLEEFEFGARPTFYSGVVTNGEITKQVIEEEEIDFLNVFIPTQETVVEFDLAAGPQATAKLAVLPSGTHDELFINAQGVIAQTFAIKPSFFSGNMRNLVAVLLGFGKQSPLSLTDKGYQLTYDYKFARTHGLIKASDDRWWLIQISNFDGVIAIQLRVDPIAETERIVGSQLETLHDLFGGFPLGNVFPPRLELDAFISAGTVLRLLTAAQVNDFYNKQAFTSMVGWAFNSTGNEAHNCVWQFDPDGIQHTYHYAVVMTIGDFIPVTITASHSRLLSELSSLEDFTEADAAKIFRLSQLLVESVLFIIDAGVANAKIVALEKLKGLTGLPEANNTASLRLQRSGRVFHERGNDPTSSLLPFKLPESGGLGLGVYSHDFGPNKPFTFPKQDEYLNAPLFVYFEGDRIEVVFFNRLFFVDGVGFSDTTNTTPECPFVGSWEVTTVSGTYDIPQRFYSTSFDVRAALNENINSTVITGEVVGFLPYVFGHNPQDPRVGFGFRDKAFKLNFERIVHSGAAAGTAIVVPIGDREAYFHFEFNQTATQTRDIGFTYATLRDPNSFGTLRQFTSSGIIITPQGCVIGEGADPDIVVSHGYSPGLCTYLADEGPFLDICAAVSQQPGRPLVNFLFPTSTTNEKTATLSLASAAFGNIVIDTTPDDIDLWFKPSPTEGNVVQTLIASVINVRNANGIYMVAPDRFDYEVLGAFALENKLLIQEKSVFIGVI